MGQAVKPVLAKTDFVLQQDTLAFNKYKDLDEWLPMQPKCESSSDSESESKHP